MKPELSNFLAWIGKQKNGVYQFESPTDCVVARWIKATQNEKDHYRFEGGNWSGMFPGSDQSERLCAYHWICNQKPMDYAGVIARAASLAGVTAEKQG